MKKVVQDEKLSRSSLIDHLLCHEGKINTLLQSPEFSEIKEFIVNQDELEINKSSDKINL